MNKLVMWVLVAILSLVLATFVAYIIDKVEQKFKKFE